MFRIEERLRKTTRKRAFISHLTLSLIIFAVITHLMFFYMYPQPFFEIDGGWQGFKILILVDIILGPCVTLVIFNPQKEKLLSDVTIIIAIQVGSLIYGLHAIYTSRPAIIAYADDTIRTIPYSSMIDAGTPPELIEQIPIFTPLWIYADIPREVVHPEQLTDLHKVDLYESTQNLKREALENNQPFYLIDRVRNPFDDSIESMISYQLGTDRIGKYHSELQDQLKENEQLIQVKGRYLSQVCIFNPKGKIFRKCTKTRRDFGWM